LLNLHDEQVFKIVREQRDKEAKRGDTWQEVLQRLDKKGPTTLRRLRASAWLGKISHRTVAPDRRQPELLAALESAIRTYVANHREQLTPLLRDALVGESVPTTSRGSDVSEPTSLAVESGTQVIVQLPTVVEQVKPESRPVNDRVRPRRRLIPSLVFALVFAISMLILHLTIIFAPLIYDVQTWSIAREPAIIGSMFGMMFLLALGLAIWRRLWWIVTLPLVASLIFGYVTWKSYGSIAAQTRAATPNVNSKNLGSIWPLGWNILNQSDSPCPTTPTIGTGRSEVVPASRCESRDGVTYIDLVSRKFGQLAEYSIDRIRYDRYTAVQQHDKTYYIETRVHPENDTSLAACGIEFGTDEVRGVFSIAPASRPVRPTIFQDSLIYKVLYVQVIPSSSVLGVTVSPIPSTSGFEGSMSPTFVGKSSVVGWDDDYWTKLGVYRDGDHVVLLVNDRVVADVTPFDVARESTGPQTSVPRQASEKILEIMSPAVLGGLGGTSGRASCAFQYFSFVDFLQ